MNELLPLGAWSLSTWALLAIGAAGFVAVMFRADDRVESRRKVAGRAAAECRAIGDDLLARILESYAVGDYTGVGAEIRVVVEKLLDPDGGGAVAMRAKMIAKILPELRKHPVYGPQIAEALAEENARAQAAQTAAAPRSALR